MKSSYITTEDMHNSPEWRALEAKLANAYLQRDEAVKARCEETKSKNRYKRGCSIIIELLALDPSSPKAVQLMIELGDLALIEEGPL